MKRAYWIPVFLACGGLFAEHAAGGDATAPGSKETSISPTDRDLITSEMLRLFLNDISKKFSRSSIYYVMVPAGARVNLENFANQSYQLKTASGREFNSGDCIDEATQQPCEVVTVGIKSIDGDSALATVSWKTSQRNGLLMDYRLMRSGDDWKATTMVSAGAYWS